MSNVKVKIDDKDLTNYLKKMKKSGKDFKPLFTIFCGKMREDILINFRREGSYGDMLSGSGKPSIMFKPWKPLSNFTKLNRPSGAILQVTNLLRESIGTVKRILPYILEYGTNVQYAPMMHFGTKGLPGGVLTPKRSKYLSLPFPGVKLRARQYTNTFFRRTKKGNLVLFQYRDDQIYPLFLMVKSVKIPARPFMTLSPKTLEEMTKLTAWYITKE